MRYAGLLVVIWLIVGAIAAGQRGYFTNAEQNCASVGTIAVTVIAGPLNYVGVNPKVTDCNMPQPSP
jgi:membrane protein YdbS with pleckstrin-like domain